MKKWIVWILVLSVSANLYFLAEKYWMGMSFVNNKDTVILGEMTQLVLETGEYQQLAEKETVYSITTGVDRNKGGAYPYHYAVVVKTDKQAYFFSCSDKTCSYVELNGTMYSDYSEGETKLPLKD